MSRSRGHHTRYWKRVCDRVTHERNVVLPRQRMLDADMLDQINQVEPPAVALWEAFDEWLTFCGEMESES